MRFEERCESTELLRVGRYATVGIVRSIDVSRVLYLHLSSGRLLRRQVVLQHLWHQLQSGNKNFMIDCAGLVMHAESSHTHHTIWIRDRVLVGLALIVVQMRGSSEG